MSTHTFVGEDRPDGWTATELDRTARSLKDRLRFRLQFFELMMITGREKEAVEAIHQVYELIDQVKD
jgi:hypothetical protein